MNARQSPRRLRALAAAGKWLALLTACGALTACATGALGTPDTSSEPIPPARPSPFGSDGAGSSAPDFSDAQPLRF